jgi:hypothetical protein
LSNESHPYFNRFFYLGHESSKAYTPGKTIHFTDTSEQVSVHLTTSKLKRLDFNVGHLGHFRPFISHIIMRYDYIPIKAIGIDFNYLYCLYKPILNL